jgi:hypothetical protein
MNQTELARSAAPKIAPDAVFRLIYRSRSLIPAAGLDAALGDILRGARAKNAALGITGALLLYDDWFAQTLEGPEAAVRTLFARIKADSRHSSVQLSEEATVPSRAFSRWAMAMVGEHGSPDIPLAATSSGTTAAQARNTTPDQDRILGLMRDATRGYGRGS